MTPDPSTTDNRQTEDPLLACLEDVATSHGVSVNRAAVLAGLPLENGRLTPGLLLRAAQRAGFRARLVERPVHRLPKSVLPAIMLLVGNRAGVLAPRERNGAVSFHLPGPGQPETTEAELKRSYTGFAVLLQPHATHTEERRPNPQRWFWHTMWKFRGYYSRLIPAALMISVLAMVMPLFTMLVYDRVVPNDATETMWVLAIGVVLVFAFEYLLRLVRGRVLERAGREMDMVLASTLYEQILSIEMQARPPSAGVLAARTKAYEVLRDFFMSATMLAVVDLPFSTLMIGAVFFVAGPVGWILVVAATTALVFGCLVQIPLRRSVVASSEDGVERQAMVAETINGLESLKGAGAEGAMQQRFEKMISSSAEKDVHMHWYGLLSSSTTAALINLTTVALIVACVYRVKEGELTMGGMIAAVMLSSRTMTPIAMVTGLMTRLQQSLQALHSLNTVMALPRETGGDRKFVQRSGFDFNYTFEHVAVRYPGQQTPALNELNLKILQGQRVALLGRMGSGKTTLLRLLAKIYEPTEGNVLLDGVDLAQYHPAVLRHEIGFLAQDATVFRGTIRENVALSAYAATDEEVLQAIRLAGLEAFVRRNPQGLHAQVGEQGSMLSGGQRRALVLARCFLTRPRLLLLDEPTANMDPQSENEFVQALNRYLDQDAKHTLVLSTHKTGLLTLADHLIVLDQGRLFAAGPKAEVLAKLSGQTGANPPTASAKSKSKTAA